ncbi:hypothetical protein Lal_00021851 [Lupinus albus]|nr:hypothetical protein Lal_00021851 [Lupinus albus]
MSLKSIPPNWQCQTFEKMLQIVPLSTMSNLLAESLNWLSLCLNASGTLSSEAIASTFLTRILRHNSCNGGTEKLEPIFPLSVLGTHLIESTKLLSAETPPGWTLFTIRSLIIFIAVEKGPGQSSISGSTSGRSGDGRFSSLPSNSLSGKSALSSERLTSKSLISYSMPDPPSPTSPDKSPSTITALLFSSLLKPLRLLLLEPFSLVLQSKFLNPSLSGKSTLSSKSLISNSMPNSPSPTSPDKSPSTITALPFSSLLKPLRPLLLEPSSLVLQSKFLDPPLSGGSTLSSESLISDSTPNSTSTSPDKLSPTITASPFSSLLKFLRPLFLEPFSLLFLQSKFLNSSLSCKATLSSIQFKFKSFISDSWLNSPSPPPTTTSSKSPSTTTTFPFSSLLNLLRLRLRLDPSLTLPLTSPLNFLLPLLLLSHSSVTLLLISNSEPNLTSTTFTTKSSFSKSSFPISSSSHDFSRVGLVENPNSSRRRKTVVNGGEAEAASAKRSGEGRVLEDDIFTINKRNGNEATDENGEIM